MNKSKITIKTLLNSSSFFIYMAGKNKVLIGLEIHGYIETKEKLFCNCKNHHNMKKIKPNTNICPVCTGQPGSKPMLPNFSAINKILQISLMLKCKPNLIDEKKPIFFQRKHYDWPDMPSGYQRTISGAHSLPVAENGEFLGVRIREVHLEEDPAAWNPEKGTVDYNRAGVPLVEIVTEPDLKSKEETQNWLKQLILTLSYVKALNKDAGIKADVNVNIEGISKRVEIKNVNSIDEIGNAIEYEIQRHIKENPKIPETRRWNTIKEKTELMRTKEGQHDYRFIPDPDLPVIKITKKRVSEIKKSLPESPIEKLNNIIKKYKIDKTNAEILIQNIDIAGLYEKVIQNKNIDPKFALPWITVEWFSVLNYNKKSMDEINLNPEHIAELLILLKNNKITPLKAKEILRKFIPNSFSPKQEAEKSKKIINKEELRKIIKNILKDNQNKKSIEDYKSGETKALNFLMGQVMQKTNKQADFNIAKSILEEELKR